MESPFQFGPNTTDASTLKQTSRQMRQQMFAHNTLDMVEDEKSLFWIGFICVEHFRIPKRIKMRLAEKAVLPERVILNFALRNDRVRTLYY